MILFHGGCHGCTQQETHGTELCQRCCFFEAFWALPNLNNQPPDEAQVERVRLLRRNVIVAMALDTGREPCEICHRHGKCGRERRITHETP